MDTLLTKQAPTTALSANQVDFFRENGFLTVEQITTPEEVAWMRKIYDRLFEERAGRDSGDQFDLAGTDEEDRTAKTPQILEPRKYAQELENTIYRSNAFAIAAQLLGPQVEFTFDHAILKPAFSGTPTPWHQDEAYWDPSFDHYSLSVWMPLQDVNVENGCMQFVPGSHKQEVLPHRSIGNDPRVHGLELDGEVNIQSMIACPLSAGGATFHASRTLHYTGPNNSSAPRRAYILIFSAPKTPRSDGRKFPWNENKRTAREERARSLQPN
jgi:ectoine hydroxylase-related dioxygenase (phytanoyl-CoA dioxygenase family)